MTLGSNYRSSTSLNDPTLPYIILGLGDTPNFIEKITIGLAHDVPNAGWYRQWHLLVPNSQVILIPRPTYKPSKYVKLLLCIEVDKSISMGLEQVSSI